MQSGFKDHFSDKSALYARYRPRYPDAFFDYLASLCPRRALAWDCATGSGQAAVSLARHFDAVIASDASEAQIQAAEPAAGVRYVVAPAEASGLGGGSVDLITVGQALHWFDMPRFFAEAMRVATDDGLLAVWTYGLSRISAALDPIVVELYSDITGPYWPPERDLVESAYADIEFPGTELTSPDFDMRLDWSMADMLGYLRTWSASKRFARANGEDPVAIVESRLREAWGDERRTVVWPLTIRLFRL